MKTIKRAAVLGLFALLFLLPATQASAGDLSSWGNYFPHSQSTVNTYGFALRQTSQGIVPHAETNAINYYFETNEAFTCFGTAIPTQAGGVWGGRLVFTNTEKVDAIVSVDMVQQPPADHPTYLAAVAIGSEDMDANGVLYTGGGVVMTAYALNVANCSNAALAHIFAHEMGHVAGLADVYDVSANADMVQNSIMYSCNRANPVTAVSRYDVNGLYIVRHMPWHNTGTSWRYWSSPGNFYTSTWKNLMDTDGIYKCYSFGSNGDARTGWQYLYDSSGYYYFFFDSGGAMQINQWISPSRTGNNRTTWGYADASGRAKTGGWHHIYDSSGYYYFFFDSSGVMLIDQWISPSKAGNNRTTWGYADASGRAKTGWATLLDGGSSYRFHFDGSGNMNTGWFYDTNNHWYYLGNGSGRMEKGWVNLSDGKYFLRIANDIPIAGYDGTLIISRSFTVNGTTYYADAAGRVTP